MTKQGLIRTLTIFEQVAELNFLLRHLDKILFRVGPTDMSLEQARQVVNSDPLFATEFRALVEQHATRLRDLYLKKLEWAGVPYEEEK